jgi:hypothetical protein
MKKWIEFNESKEEHRVNDDKLYHLFRVYDYKGGELSASTNLSRLDICNEIIEYFFNDDKLKIDQNNEDLKKTMGRIVNENSSIYAGGDDWCGNIFFTEDKILKSCSISSFFDDIIDILRWDNI